MPEDFCPSAWEVMRPFVESLARGEGNFFDGWMQNPMSAMISCNDGFIHVRFVDYLFFFIIIYVAEAKMCRLGALNILNGIKKWCEIIAPL